jgi:hypothetical protein
MLEYRQAGIAKQESSHILDGKTGKTKIPKRWKSINWLLGPNDGVLLEKMPLCLASCNTLLTCSIHSKR